MTANRLVTIYSRALAIGGLVALGAALIVDPRWTGQPLEILGLLVAALLLRGPLTGRASSPAEQESHPGDAP